MAGFDVFICGAFEELEEARVAGIVTDVHSKNQIRFSRFSQMTEGSPWKTIRWGCVRGSCETCSMATARIMSTFAFQFPL